MSSSTNHGLETFISKYYAAKDSLTTMSVGLCKISFTLFDMSFFWTVSHGGGGYEAPPHHNFVVIAPMIMKFGTGVKLDVFYTMVTKKLWRHYCYDIMTS